MKKISSIHSLTLTSIGAAMIAALSQISFSVGPIPFTLQTFAIGLIATVFRFREAVGSVLLYILLGACGLPVFSGHGGIAVLQGPSAGFIWGFVVYVLVTSSLTNSKTSKIQVFLANLLGDAMVFLLGIAWLVFMAKMEWSAALAVGLYPFIITDLIKIFFITIFSQLIFASLKGNSYFK